MLKKIITIIMGLSLLLLMGCQRPTNKEATEEIYEYDAVPVVVVSVVSDDVYESIYTVGEIHPAEQYQVNAMTNGDVLEVMVQVGDAVLEGDVLFTIETTDFEVDKNTSLIQSANSVSQAKISYNTAKSNYDNNQTLFDSGVVSQSALDNAKNSYENARIVYNNASQSYESVKHNYENQGSKYSVTSPVSGIVSAGTVSEDMYATSQNGFTIDLVERYVVTTQVASKYINDVKKGQEVELYISTVNLLVKGTVDSVSLNGSNGTYPIEVKLDEETKILKAGMYADIWILTNKSSEGLWINNQSLLQENGESFVYEVIGGKASKVLVNILSRRGDLIAVKSDLNKDSQLITLGKEYVLEGSKVEIK